MNLRRWLRPGIGVKRWLGVAFVGLTMLALAGALALRQLYREVEVDGPIQAVISVLTLQFLPYWIRAAALLAVGIGLFAFGSYRVILALLGPFTESADEPLVDLVYRRRLLARGPRIVAIGGGTGLSTLLRGLKEHTANLTAIVSVADDGGSTGRLREQVGIPAVGDIRNCLVALAETEPAMGELLQYRFGNDEGSLSGHAVGNLLITAMHAIDGGDFEAAVRQMNRVLAVRGSVVPASGTALTLHARLRDGSEVAGQSRVMRMRGIERVWLEPSDVRASRDALQAIAEADLVILGPGSLYTVSSRRSSCRSSARRSRGPRRRGCTSRTSRRRPARPRGTTWPTTSRRSPRTASGSSSTSSSPTTTSRGPVPTRRQGSP